MKAVLDNKQPSNKNSEVFHNSEIQRKCHKSYIVKAAEAAQNPHVIKPVRLCVVQQKAACTAQKSGHKSHKSLS